MMMNHSNEYDLNMSASFTTSLITPGPLIACASKEGYEDSDTAQAPVSSRWNPTPEQVEVLEEMFRLGTRSPTAEHIQQITALLRRFGRVEGKNVFYWFQNHKARERQRRRRQKLDMYIASQQQMCYGTQRKKTGVRRACCDIQESSIWRSLSFSSCNSLPEEAVSVQTTRTGSTHGWTQYQESLPSSSLTTCLPLKQAQHHENQHSQYQMLELFPLGNGSNNSTSLSPSHFVEFLPPKN